MSKAFGRASQNGVLQRKCACGGTCPSCAGKKPLQRKSQAGSARFPSALPIVDHVLASPGYALDAATRTAMESAFDEDFADVRVHTDARAADSAEEVDAFAYTVGRDIVFGPGQFSTTTVRGRELLAHELTHVVQQSARSGGVAMHDAALEGEADAAAHAVVSGGSASAAGAAPVGLSRKPKKKDEEVAARLVASKGPGTVSVTFEGAPILTISYEAAKGEAQVSVSRDSETGLEAADIYVPPDSNPRRSLDPRYNEFYAQGKLTLSEYEESDEYYLLASAVNAPIKRPEPKPQTEKPVEKPPEPAPVEQDDEESTAAKQKKAETPPEKLPEKSADQMIDEHTSWANLDEDALGQELLKYALSGDTAQAQAVLTALGSTDRDDVAVAFVEHAKEEDLLKLASTPDGKRLLSRLLDELSSGYEGDDERAAAERIKAALLQSKSPEDLVAEVKRAPVIPFSGIGWTKFSSASIDATRLDNGKIRIKTHMKQEHWKYAKNMSTQFAVGLDTMDLDPDALVVIYNIDEGGKEVAVPAAALLQMSNQEDMKAYMMGGEAVITGLTLGSGGGILAGGEAAGEGTTVALEGEEAVQSSRAIWAARGATALKWGDRVATVFGAANTLITEHRGLILSKFGKSGESFLEGWKVVQTVLAVYSVGRGAVALGQTAVSIRGALKEMKARRAAVALSKEEEQALDELILQSEQTLDEIEQAAPSAKGSTTKPSETGTPHGDDLNEPENVLATKPVGGSHHIEITAEGAKLCSPPPCPLLRVVYARQLKNRPDLTKELDELEALRATKPEEAASRAATLNQKLGDERLASMGVTRGRPTGIPADYADKAMEQVDDLENVAEAGRLRQTPVTYDVDEPLPVGEAGLAQQHARNRALEPHNRQLLDPNTNRITKHVRVDPGDIERHAQSLPAVSLKDNPSALFTRRFDEVVELHDVFDEAVAEVKNAGSLKPTALKGAINKNIRDIIQNGRTPSGRAVRDALKAQGFEYREGFGIVAITQ